MLAKAPKDMVKKAPSLDMISVGQRIMQIIEKIRFGQTVPLTDLIPEPYEKHIIVATFLALLEMAIMKMIKVYQAGRFEPIYLTGTIKEASIEDVKRLIETREDKVVEVTDGTE